MPSKVTVTMRLTTIETDVSHIRKTTDEMHKILHGNGDTKAGLVSRLTVTETVVERIERIVWLSVGSAITAVVGAVFAVLRSGG